MQVLQSISYSHRHLEHELHHQAMERIHSIHPIDRRMQGHFLNLYAVALADLTLDPDELKLLFDFGARRGIDRGQIEELLLNPHAVEASVPTDVLGRVKCLYEFAQMIWSDGRVDPAEKELLERFSLAFAFEEENVPEIADFLLSKAEQGTNAEDVLAAVRKNLAIEE